MFGGIICWRCCWVCCWSRSIATANHGRTNELDSRGKLGVQLAERFGVVGEAWLARLSAGLCVCARTLKSRRGTGAYVITKSAAVGGGDGR